MTGHLRQPIWVVPLAIAGLVAIFGWWGNARLRQTIEEELKEDLAATLNANVTALEIWTADQEKLATILAEEPRVRALAIRIFEALEQANGDTNKLSELPGLQEVGSYLRPRLMRRDTAVKLLLPDRADPDSIQRFEREVCLTCQLTHPNTIQVYDYGHTPEGIFYYAMEFLRGLNLHELVPRFGPQPEGRVVHILTQICDSLAEAHALGLVHRDIKPANIFLCDRGGVPGCVKVLDFGLVREYRNGSRDFTRLIGGNGAEGTPLFMPPEAIEDSARSDPRSDIYSVGALGYYLLTGEYVFAAESIRDLYDKHVAASPIPPSQRTTNRISAALEATILRCLEKEPDVRPQSVTELRALLLTSPRASEWGPQARAAWWSRYQSKTSASADETDLRESSSIDASVKIDFDSRLK